MKISNHWVENSRCIAQIQNGVSTASRTIIHRATANYYTKNCPRVTWNNFLVMGYIYHALYSIHWSMFACSVPLDQTKLFNLLYVKKWKYPTIGLKIHDALHKFKTVFQPHQGQLSIGLLRTITPKIVHVFFFFFLFHQGPGHMPQMHRSL